MHGDAFSKNGWLRVLPVLGEELETLGKSTEGEFLSLGEKLQKYYEQAGELSKISESVASLMAGEEIETIIKGFHGIIERIEALEGESRRNAATLQRLLDTLSELNGNLSGFHKTVRSLGVLCVSIRVESARLGKKDIGFNILADEVGKLASEIEEKYSNLLARTESLSHLIVQALSRVSDLEKRQHTQTSFILDKSVSSLEAVTQTHSLSSSGATHIATRYGAISRRIGEIVSSMQFHDITRQRIEHAKEALDSIAGNPQTTDDPDHGAEDEEIDKETSGRMIERPRLGFGGNGKRSQTGRNLERLRLATNICELQIAQLHNARDAFVSAVGNIVENLREVAGLVAEMARETQKMAGAADQTGRSLLSDVEKGFSGVTSAFSSYTDTDRELSSVMGSLGETLGDMSTFADAIEGIGDRIKLIALNAIVKASHIGEDGVTLAVLAESVHHLSIETRSRTERVGETLRSMTAESESLCEANHEEETVKHNELDRVHEGVAALLGDLRKVNHDIVTLLTQMNDKGDNLSEDILKTLAEITVHYQIKEVINGVVAQLEEIAALTRSLSPIDGRPNGAEHLQSLEASYTMQDEREIHRSLWATDATLQEDDSNSHDVETARETKSERVDEKADEEEDLGDNVELF